MANKIRLGRATKARIETIKETLDNYELVYSLDTNELGVKNGDGTVTYFGVVTELEWANILSKPNFATVATSGAYTDLTGTPDLDLKLDKDFSALPAQANPLLTDVLVLNRGTTVQKVTLGNLLAQVDTQLYLVVTELPTTGVVNKIYLVPGSDPETQNVLDEYIWVDNAWEKIGAVKVDLSNYFNKTEINSILESKVDKNANITAGTSPKITYDAKGLVTGGAALAATDIPNLNASKINAGEFDAARIPSLAASKISSETFDAARIPNLAPTKITQNASNRFVTDVEKAYWDDKVDKNADINAGTSPKITYDAKGLVTGGEALVAEDIPNLDAGKINSGAFLEARIPNLDASKINAGVFGVARIPELAISKITNLQSTLNTKLDANSTIDGGDL